MLKAVLLTAALASRSLALEWNHEFTSEQLANENMFELFQKWRFEYSKVYGSVEEEMRRFEVFSGHMKRIGQRNDDFHNGDISFQVRINHFGDLSDEERTALFHPIEDIDSFENGKRAINDPIEMENVLVGDSHFDWRDSHKVGSVKAQGSCGSCWAFAAAATMECNYAIATGKSPPDLSEQQLVDCDTVSYACYGGWSDKAMDVAIAHGGMCSEADYPYTRARYDDCGDSDCIQSKWKPTGYEYGIAGCPQCLASSVRKGCVVVHIEGSGWDFTHYSNGVFDGDCGDDLDHAVALTGYGTMDGKEYWIIKNSEGPNWGDEGGYVYVCKNCMKNTNNGQCGILKKRCILPNY